MKIWKQSESTESDSDLGEEYMIRINVMTAQMRGVLKVRRYRERQRSQPQHQAQHQPQRPPECVEEVTEKMPKKRLRFKSLNRRLELALHESEMLTKGKLSRDSRMQLRSVDRRIKSLLILTARHRRDELKTLHEELAAKDAEIERLKTELAARPAPAPVIPVAFRPKAIDNDVSAILAQVAEEEKQ